MQLEQRDLGAGGRLHGTVPPQEFADSRREELNRVVTDGSGGGHARAARKFRPC